MAGTRPFDDGRFPDAEMFAECFLCGKKVDPLDPKRGTYDEPPAGAELPIHLPCLDEHLPPPSPDGRRKRRLSLLYHIALNEMAERQLAIFQGH